MPAKLPLRFASTRVKSPAPRQRQRPSIRPSRSPGAAKPSSSRRSRSHDPGRRPSESSPGRHPPSAQWSSRTGPRNPERHRPPSSPSASNGRHRRRRDSSSSPERYHRRVDRDYLRDGRDRPRPSSAAPDRDRRPPKDRRSSVEYRSPPRIRLGASPEASNREGGNDPRREQRRSSTPDRYQPDRYKERASKSRDPRPSRPTSNDPPASTNPETNAPAKLDVKHEAAGASSSGVSNLFGHTTTAFAAHAGIQAVSKHADVAKEWISWLNDLNETPEEIQSMSAKATTARDTMTQVQESLKARPDLVEGESGLQLKEQIEDAIKDTDKALGRMTRVLSEVSKEGADHGDVMNGMQDFWRSYRYKDEFEDKVKEADDDLQKKMTALSTLMVNIYSRALMKPAPPGVGGTVPPPAPKREVEAPTLSETSKESANSPPQSIPRIVEPQYKVEEPTGAPLETGESAKRGSEEKPASPADVNAATPPPPSTSAVAAEEAMVGSPGTHAGIPPVRDDRRYSGGSPTPPPTSAGVDRDEARSKSPSREALGSFSSEQEAQDALLDAAWDGDLDGAARALRFVSHGCCDVRGMTPLHLASERDNLAVAMLLLDQGASDIDARSDGGRTALHLAARSASASTVEMLLDRGRAYADAQTAKGRTPLHYAASKAEEGDEERREVLRALRDWGADPTIEDRDGETARDVAQKRGHWDAAATLRRAEKKWEEDHKQNWLQRHGFMK